MYLAGDPLKKKIAAVASDLYKQWKDTSVVAVSDVKDLTPARLPGGSTASSSGGSVEIRIAAPPPKRARGGGGKAITSNAMMKTVGPTKDTIVKVDPRVGD